MASRQCSKTGFRPTCKPFDVFLKYYTEIKFREGNLKKQSVMRAEARKFYNRLTQDQIDKLCSPLLRKRCNHKLNKINKAFSNALYFNSLRHVMLPEGQAPSQYIKGEYRRNINLIENYYQNYTKSGHVRKGIAVIRRASRSSRSPRRRRSSSPVRVLRNERLY